MKNLKPLVLLQLKEKIDLSFLKSKKATIFKIVLAILKFVLVTAVIYVGFYLLNYLRIVSTLPGIPINLLVVVFTIMFFLSVLVCTFGLMQNLYFSQENKLLLTLPATKSEVFTSKMIVYFIYELRKNFVFFLPLFVAYALINSLPFYAYLWFIFAVVILTAFIVVISAFLSIPAMVVVRSVRRVKWLEYSLIALLLAGIVAVVIYLIACIPENINLIANWENICESIQNFMNEFARIFVPLAWIVTSFVGSQNGVKNQFMPWQQAVIMLGIIGTTIAIFALTYLIVKPLYFKMASSSFEHKSQAKERKPKNRQLHPFLSAVKKELLLTLRSTNKLTGLLFTTIVMPVAIFLLNKIYAAMDTRLMGLYMVIAFNIIIILLFALSTNVFFSHIYSEEGRVSYLAKVSPKPYIKVLFPKLVINLVATSLAIVTSTAVFASAVGFVFWQWLLVFLIVEIVFLAHAFWSAELDIMNSQTSYYKTSGSHIANPNEVKSTAVAFLLSVIIGFLVFFFIQENQVTVWFKVLVIAIILFVIRLWLYLNTIKVYYKERE